MKIKYFVIILLLLTMNIFCEHFNEYIFEVVHRIPSGEKDGMIGWKALPGGFTGPSTFFVSDNKIFVPDRMNYRLNIYNRNLNFLETFFEKEDKKVYFTNTMKVDNNGNIIYISTSSDLKKVDKKGRLLFSIPNKILPNNVKSHRNYFPILDNIFIYNDENEIECITNEGEFIKGYKIQAEIKKIENERANNFLSNGMKLPPDKKKIIEDLKKENSYLLINDNFYSTDFRRTKEYYNKIKEVRIYVTSQKEETKSQNINLNNIENPIMHFIGYDENHNSYWNGIIDKPNGVTKYAVIIYSKYGELLDAFYYGQYKIGADNLSHPDIEEYPTTGALIAVAPDGDVYFLKGNEKEYTFYKVENNW